MSVVELFYYNVFVVCIYRSSDGDLYLFVKKIGISNSNCAIKNKYSNFMWRTRT
jgi:hypothetical protein